ncbi:hypothetical protein W01_18270 [Candidatus Nitrotoga sp. AM1P]|nr:hypothetical protein W01_18270 [Candidatus Nitrotoga sp. AM1P]
MLPREFPKWRTVHSYFAKWSEQGEEGMSLLERALKKSGWRGPYETGAQRTADAIDYGRAERKEHGHGGSEGYAVAVTTAEVTDRKGALQAMARCKSGLAQVQRVLADGGYGGRPFALAVDEILGASVQIAKRNELHTFAVIPKRWVVERSFAWLEKCRRLWKNCERKLNTSLQFIHLAFLVLLLRRS